MGRPPRLTRAARERRAPAVAAPAVAARARRAPAVGTSAVAVPAEPSGRELLLVAAVAAVLGIALFGGALDYGFSQDDFLSLARVRGLAPRLEGPWRILANQWFWDAGVGAFGLAARPFHAVALAVHALASVLLGLLLARRFPAPAAFLGAVAFATHPAHATALWWISAIGDPAMALCVLLATLAFLSRGRTRWLSVPAFAVALAWKESALLFPLALAALAALGPAPRRSVRELARDPVLLALAVVSLLWAGGIAAFVRGLSAAGNAYEPSPAAMGRNLLAYASWTVSPLGWWLRDVSDDARPAFVASGAVVLALAAAGLAWKPWRDRGAAGALLAALLLIAPLLPLGHHTYRYYLYAPLLAVALALAALFAAATPRLPARASWRWALGLALPLAIANGAWVERLEHAPFLRAGSRSDRTLDRAIVASLAIDDARAAGVPAGTRLALWSPQSQAETREAGGDPAAESYEERNVRASLLEGLALRVMVPEIDSVEFVRAFDSRDGRWRWGVYRWDGHLRVVAPADLARVLETAPK